MHKSIIIHSILLLALLGASFYHFNKKAGLTQEMEIPSRIVIAFRRWSSSQQKEYKSVAESNFRLQTFYKNSLKIDRFNQAAGNTWKMGLTPFADLTEEEFQAKLTYKPLSETGNTVKFNSESGLRQQSGIDLRGALQQQYISGSSVCNDNYAWVSAVTMNANYYLSKGIPNEYAFSPQVYLDCSGNFGNLACAGGNAWNSFSYSKLYGIDSLSDYPYYGYQRSCRAATSIFKNRDIGVITKGSNSELYRALDSRIVVASGLDLAGAQFYRYGVFVGPCSAVANQGVIVVGAGYDFNSSSNFWLLLNTWGPGWGENGYMRLVRYTVDSSPQDLQTTSCGLNLNAVFPIF